MIIENGKKEAMNRKLKGFSLAELLISLLIISIVLSAAIPTITRKAGADREAIWRWTNEGNNAYFGTGSNQSAILGLSSTPKAEEGIADIMQDATVVDDAVDDITDTANTGTKRADIGVINTGDLKYSNFGDKFIILKKTIQNDNSNFMNSHISFFTMKNDETATTADIKYGGRLTLDPGNIALGMGTLQNLDSDNVGENTAIGHFALLRTDEGFRNTAIGKKALSYNSSGSYNTAIGYGALFEMGRQSSSVDDAYYENTAIGALSQQQRATGRFNTSIGSQSLKRNTDGDSNTAIGRLALGNLTIGSSNTVIGDKACRYVESGNSNICIGNNVRTTNTTIGASSVSTEENYGIFIGTATEDDETPLISGHSTLVLGSGGSYSTPTAHKEFIVNSRMVEFRPFNGARPAFRFNSYYGADNSYNGYSPIAGQAVIGTSEFNLRDTGGGSDYSSVSLVFGGIGTNAQDKEARINAYDKYHANTTDKWADITFNNILRFDFPPAIHEDGTTDYGTFRMNTETPATTDYPTETKYSMLINDRLEIGNSNTVPYLQLTETEGLKFHFGTNTDSFINITKDNAFINFVSSSSIPGSLWFDLEGGLQLTTPGKITLESTGSDNVIKFGKIYIDDNEIYINDLRTFSSTGGIKAEIKGIKEEIDNLKAASSMSDERKKNILSDSTAGLKEINALEVKNYTYKDDKNNTPHVGVIAQQLQKVFPNSVFEGSDGFLRIKTEEIFYAMVNSIKELCAKLQDLTAKVTGLDKRITELENQNKILLEQNKAFEKRLEKLEKQSTK